MSRVTIAVPVALGLSGVSVALGALYATDLDIRRAELEAKLAGYELDSWDQSPLLKTFDQPGRFWTAAVSGTLGVGLLGLGGKLGAFELVSMLRGPRPNGSRPAAPLVPGPAGTK